MSRNKKRNSEIHQENIDIKNDSIYDDIPEEEAMEEFDDDSVEDIVEETADDADETIVEEDTTELDGPE